LSSDSGKISVVDDSFARKSVSQMSVNSVLRSLNQWFLNTPERALDQAYKAALMIKAIEDEHFNGKKVSADSTDQSNSVVAYFEADLYKYLQTIRVRLVEFKSSRSVFSGSEPKRINTNRIEAISNPAQYYPIELNEKQSIIIEKLKFIDEIIAKYSESEQPKSPITSLVPLSQKQANQVIKADINDLITNEGNSDEPRNLQKPGDSKNTNLDNLPSGKTDKTGVLPRSILRTFNRIQEELDPKAEEKVVKNFRNSKLKTIISLKFLLTLIIIPILTQQVTKTFVVSPIIEKLRHEGEKIEVAHVFLNLDLEEEAFVELKRFEEELRFRNLLGFSPPINQEERTEKVKEKAKEIAEEYQDRSNNAIKNIFADLLSLVAFVLVIINSKQDIAILKSFMDDIVYGLSDSAKAFIIILFTDIFVGFHSPHGWEVILEGVSRHLGLPESREFIFLFIATFPVILDSVIKYWIFRYLNRVSPSAVATLRGMNE
jgi:CemA family